MEIRDVLHGSISIDSNELPIIDSRYFQRLRQIKQLGFAEYSFPSATHNRYIHSLGAMSVASKAFDSIFGGSPLLSSKAFHRFRRVLRLAALLHDIGHGPLSHTIEFAMPEIRTSRGKKRKATHEDYTLRILLDSELSTLIEKTGAHMGFGPAEVAGLIQLDEPYETIAVGTPANTDFFLEKVEGETIDFRPILRQLISSELDADRMDYLRRDSLHAGVSYGQFDFSWLVGNLSWQIKNSKCYLALQHRALYAFEDFLISRYHMFLMVYFHYKTVVYDEMLRQYLSSEDCTYDLPSDIEKYCECTDSQLYAHLAKQATETGNEWASRIIEKRPYRMLIELHSGIPATKTAFLEQKRLLARIERELNQQGIRYLNATSTSELSKYFKKPGDPIFVLYDNHYSKPSSIPLEQCTDLFQRYSEKREITRLYVSPENYAACRHRGRGEPLPYEDLQAPSSS